MTRVIVHAGFHKTGTTSLQEFMLDNRDALTPYLAYYGKAALLEAGSDARIYAQKPFPWRLSRFRRSFRKALKSLPDTETIVLSRETFSGGMPGHRRGSGALMRSYFGPALRLARVITAELRRRFGAEVEITFFYTTRAREDWIRSVHGHLLRSIRLTDDFDSFRARFPALSSPEEEARRLRAALAPLPVVTAALEDWGAHPEGPAGALLDLVGVPAATRATLTPAQRANPGQSPEQMSAFLALNRDTASKTALKSRKITVLSDRE